MTASASSPVEASASTGARAGGAARVEIVGVAVRGLAERGKARASLVNVTLVHAGNEEGGVLGIIGAQKDGTTVLFDLLDGSLKPKVGRVTVLGHTPSSSGSSDAALRSRVARVSLDAPLPEALRVQEVCDLAADVRGEPRVRAAERLAVLGLATLAERRVRSLSVEERRAVALAIALTSKKVDLLLVEEPLVSMDPIAPRLVIDALRARGDQGACVIITTASPRDATRIADRLGLLTNGTYAPLPPEVAHVGAAAFGIGPEKREDVAVQRIVVTPSQGTAGAAQLVAALSANAAITRIETMTARSGSVTIVVSGRDLLLLSSAVTYAIASTRIDVELIEPTVLPLDAIRAAFAARAAALAAPPAPLQLPQPPQPPPQASVQEQEQPAASEIAAPQGPSPTSPPPPTSIPPTPPMPEGEDTGGDRGGSHEPAGGGGGDRNAGGGGGSGTP